MSQDQAQPTPRKIVQSPPATRRELDQRWSSEAAYFIWEKEGHPHGRDLDHRLRAEYEGRRLIDAGKLRMPVR